MTLCQRRNVVDFSFLLRFVASFYREMLFKISFINYFTYFIYRLDTRPGDIQYH